MVEDPDNRNESRTATPRSTSHQLTSCRACRAAKTKCVTEEDCEDCERCLRREERCERPSVNKGGRPRGSLNRSSTVERAVQVINRELIRSTDRNHDVSQIQQGPADHTFSFPAENSRSSFGTAQPVINGGGFSSGFDGMSDGLLHQSTSIATSQLRQPPFEASPGDRASLSQQKPTSRQDGILSVSPHSLTSQSHHPTGSTHAPDGSLSNPVHLLAEAAEEETRASSLEPTDENTQNSNNTAQKSAQPDSLPNSLRAILRESHSQDPNDSIRFNSTYLIEGLDAMLSETARRTLDHDDRRFFKPARKKVNRDVGAEYDPLSLALLAPKEVKLFFNGFFQHLHPLLPVLDPVLHTPDFVRKRSAFLFTAICAHGASMTPGAEEATKRLRIHTQRLSDAVSRRGFASVEVVQAFLIWISWLPSSEPFQEERLWHATKYAINMAIELGLDSPMPSSLDEIYAEISISSSAHGTSTNDWSSVERVIRNRQRLWIHLFLWDANLSLAFGKATRFTQNDLIRDEAWCFHHLATKHDPVTTACVVLRKRLANLTDTIRSEIYNHNHPTSEWVAKMVDETLGPWHTFWTAQCGGSAYLELLYRHTRLWILSFGLQALSSSEGSQGALTLHCFQAALDSCEFVCEKLKGSRDLWGLPNSIGPMLSFEALLAVRLFPTTPEGSTSRKARLLGLLAHLSLLLEQVGATPSHRLGTAAVYGRHLQVYIRRRVISLCTAYRQYESTQSTGDVPVSMVSHSHISPVQVDAAITQFFNIDQLLPTLQPTDSTDASGLTWNFADPSTSFDNPASWTDGFSQLFETEL